jgi:hypothetical protein
MSDDGYCQNTYCKGKAEYGIIKPGSMRAAIMPSEINAKDFGLAETLYLCASCYLESMKNQKGD